MSEPDSTTRNSQPHIDGDAARAGATPHVTRYILGISLTLVIVIFALLLLWR